MIDGFAYEVGRFGRRNAWRSAKGAFLVHALYNRPNADQKLCHVLSQEHTLSVVVDARRAVGVCAFQHDFPGRRAAIRIDGGTPIDIGTERCSGPSTAGRLAPKGKTAIVRWYKWPNDVSQDADVSLAGLSAAIALAQRVHRNEIK